MCECKMYLRARFKTNGPQLDVVEKKKSIPTAVKLELSSYSAVQPTEKSMTGRDFILKWVLSRYSVSRLVKDAPYTLTQNNLILSYFHSYFVRI